MQYTATQIADIFRLFLTVVCVVIVVIVALWAVMRTTTIEAAGTPGMPVVSVTHEQATAPTNGIGNE
ncbi:MAG: hypothetical protein AAGI37_16535 [Planctomycetota bacterium]